MATHGFLGASVGHFDFGENLRRAALEPGRYPALDVTEVSVVRHVLETGALLEDHQFPIIEKLFTSFVAQNGLKETDWVLLNGMPRHVGQAEAVGRFADIQYVANLVCDESVVYGRIRSNAGGDRAGRVDDDMAAVRNKLAIFSARTLPLIDYYRQKGVMVIDIPVGMQTTPAEIVSRLGR